MPTPTEPEPDPTRRCGWCGDELACDEVTECRACQRAHYCDEDDGDEDGN